LVLRLIYHQFNFHYYIYSNSFVTNGSICHHFNRPNRTNYITRILQVSWDYHFLPRSIGIINLNTNLTFTVIVILLQLSKMDIYVFTSKNLSSLFLMPISQRPVELQIKHFHWSSSKIGDKVQ